jgi:hypothetical protein
MSQGDVMVGIAGQVIVGASSDNANTFIAGFYANPDLLSALSVAVGDQPPEIPHEYDLSQNYPNPFNPTTKIEFALPSAGHVRLTVHNNLGQIVATVMDEEVAAGYRSAVWDGRNDSGAQVASGVYFYRIVVGTGDQESFVHVRKLMLLR